MSAYSSNNRSVSRAFANVSQRIVTAITTFFAILLAGMIFAGIFCTQSGGAASLESNGLMNVTTQYGGEGIGYDWAAATSNYSKRESHFNRRPPAAGFEEKVDEEALRKHQADLSIDEAEGENIVLPNELSQRRQAVNNTMAKPFSSASQDNVRDGNYAQVQPKTKLVPIDRKITKGTVNGALDLNPIYYYEQQNDLFQREIESIIRSIYNYSVQTYNRMMFELAKRPLAKASRIGKKYARLNRRYANSLLQNQNSAVRKEVEKRFPAIFDDEYFSHNPTSRYDVPAFPVVKTDGFVINPLQLEFQSKIYDYDRIAKEKKALNSVETDFLVNALLNINRFPKPNCPETHDEYFGLGTSIQECFEVRSFRIAPTVKDTNFAHAVDKLLITTSKNVSVLLVEDFQFKGPDYTHLINFLRAHTDISKGIKFRNCDFEQDGYKKFALGSLSHTRRVYFVKCKIDSLVKQFIKDSKSKKALIFFSAIETTHLE